MIHFSGTTFLQSRYVQGNSIGNILVKHGGFFYVHAAGDTKNPYVVVTDSLRNPKAKQIDQELRELAQRRAEAHGVKLEDIHYYSGRSNLSDRWKDKLRQKLTLDA